MLELCNESKALSLYSEGSQWPVFLVSSPAPPPLNQTLLLNQALGVEPGK